MGVYDEGEMGDDEDEHEDEDACEEEDEDVIVDAEGHEIVYDDFTGQWEYAEENRSPRSYSEKSCCVVM